MRYIDEKGRVCDPQEECFGLGIHYHCVNCWRPGGMMGCMRDGVKVCEKEELE
jgi:hypothetical protein